MSTDVPPHSRLTVVLLIAMLGTGPLVAGSAALDVATPGALDAAEALPRSAPAPLDRSVAGDAATLTVTEPTLTVADGPATATTESTTEAPPPTAPADGTNDTTSTLSGTVDDTTSTLQNETDALDDGVTNVTGDVSLGTGGGFYVNGSATAGTREDATGGADGQSSTADTSDDSGGAAQSSDGLDDESEPTRGGGLPQAAGGAAVLGVTTMVGAALLHRSARLADGSAWTTVSRWRSAGFHPGDWFRWVLWSAGYSRYDDTDPLAHETRESLFRRIERSPGIYLSALAEEASVPMSTARYHLRVLTAESLVSTAVIRGKRHYFPASTEHPALRAALEDETQRGILACIARRERATVSTLARQLDRDPSTVTYQLQHLAEADLIERDGRRVWNRLAPRVEPYFDDAVAGVETD